jgi:hypothetical protein
MPPTSYIQAQIYELDRLMTEISAGQLGIPDFQREFLWTDIRVIALLGTVFNAWPAGSLLVMRHEANAQFRLRALDGAPPLTSVRTVVLDGQQRLTALYQTLHNAGESVFLIDANDFELPGAGDYTSLEDRIITIDKEAWSKRLSTPRAQRARKLVPISALSSTSEFFSWRDEVTSEDSDDAYRELLTAIYRDCLSAIHRYSFPAIVLESDLEVSAIARIFERVNREGLRLNTFDLMVARVYEPNWNLRDEWDQAKDDYPILDEFLQTDGMPLLQVVALREVSNVRQSAVLDMNPAVVRRDWPPCVQAMNAALQFLRDRCGVTDPEWLPYQVMLVGLSALFMAQRRPSDDDLQRWFWRRSFTLHFDAAANTRIVSDYNALIGNPPGETEDPALSESTLLRATRRSHRAFWGAFMCALSHHEAREILGGHFEQGGRGEHAARSTSVFERTVPVPYGEPPLHLRVLGMVQASRTSASLIRKHGLVGAIAAAVEKQSGRSGIDAALESQFLPSSAALMDDHFNASKLLSYRADRLAAHLQDLSGLTIERDSGSR